MRVLERCGREAAKEGDDWSDAACFTGVARSGPFKMKLAHPALVKLLQKAYSGEKAAAFAYIGHARSLRDPAAKAAVRQIEEDEWKHWRNKHPQSGEL